MHKKRGINASECRTILRKPQINKAKSYKVSEDITIDKKYLEKKYPGKTVLTWVYTESENMSKKERKEFNEPLGIKYITNNQVIKLNNYLVSKGKRLCDLF